MNIKGEIILQMNYDHIVQYYETDAMQIVHHSNYIRWFEEARTWWLNKEGVSYHRLEEQGIMMPILTAEANYHKMMRFGDTAEIKLRTTDISPVKMTISYWIFNKETKELCVTGNTILGFLDSATSRPLSIKKTFPELFSQFKGWQQAYLAESTEA